MIEVETQPTKVVLIVLILIEISLIASRYSIDFDRYITAVIILLAFPIAYFAYHYLRLSAKHCSSTEQYSKSLANANDEAAAAV